MQGDVMPVKIKRQKQIRAFLLEKFGESRGNALFDIQERTLHTLIANERNKTASQMKTLARTILPCIALYI